MTVLFVWLCFFCFFLCQAVWFHILLVRAISSPCSVTSAGFGPEMGHGQGSGLDLCTFCFWMSFKGLMLCSFSRSYLCNMFMDCNIQKRCYFSQTVHRCSTNDVILKPGHRCGSWASLIPSKAANWCMKPLKLDFPATQITWIAIK